MECVLCRKGILPGEKMIRVLVEEVSRDKDEDGVDAEYWTNVEDWDVIIGMHSKCVKSALRQGKTIPYQNEMDRLEMARHLIPLRLVESG